MAKILTIESERLGFSQFYLYTNIRKGYEKSIQQYLCLKLWRKLEYVVNIPNAGIGNQ